MAERRDQILAQRMRTMSHQFLLFNRRLASMTTAFTSFSSAIEPAEIKFKGPSTDEELLWFHNLTQEVSTYPVACVINWLFSCINLISLQAPFNTDEKLSSLIAVASPGTTLVQYKRKTLLDLFLYQAVMSVTTFKDFVSCLLSAFFHVDYMKTRAFGDP